MQEVDKVSDFYIPQFAKLGYELLHYKRPRFFQSDGIAIAYRKSTINLLEVEWVDLNNVAGLYGGSRRFKRDNQAMFALFKLNSTKQKFVAGNVHLHFNPAKDDVKFG